VIDRYGLARLLSYILTSGIDDRIISLWDAQTGMQVRAFSDPAKPGVLACAPDGRTLAASGEDGTIRLWDTDFHDTIRYLCTRLRRDLTAEERATYNIVDETPTCPKP
jgi:WD40 repeat protein